MSHPHVPTLIGLNLYIILSKKRTQLFLLEEGIALHLVYSRHRRKLRHKFLPDLRCHVADANGSYLPSALLPPGFPCSGHIPVGLVQQIQVYIVKPQFFQRCFKTFLCCFISIILEPEFACDKISSLGIPLSFTAFPTSASLKYAAAVFNMTVSCLYARVTASYVAPSFGIRNTPNPTAGILFPSFKVTISIAHTS
mgnify:CR=1 FL=1